MGRGKINFKELAKRLYLDSGTLTPVIKKLEAMNLIIKYRNKEDDRVVTVELTDKGRELKDKVLEVPDKMLCNFKGDTENLLALKNYLDEMIASLEK